MMALYLSGDPALQKLAEASATATKPINVRQGGSVFNPATGKVDFAAPQNGIQTTYGPQGPQASPVPGYLQAAAANAQGLAGATEAGKLPYETVPVTNASGATAPTFKSQLPGAPQIQQPGQPSQVPQTVPQGPQVSAPAMPAPVQAGPWATMPRLQTPQGLGQSTYQKTVQEKTGEEAHALAQKYGSAADTANQRLALNQQAMSLVDKADTGPGAASIAEVKNVLTSRFGIPESSFANTQSATTALQKDLLNAATQKAKQQFGARMTQSEVMLMLSKGSPNIDMPLEAIKYLLSSDTAAAKYEIQRSNDYGKYLQNNGDPLKFEGWYTKTFPLSQATGQVHMNQPEQSSNPQAIMDEMKRRGLIK
jgi:hypothetical protein